MLAPRPMLILPNENIDGILLGTMRLLESAPCRARRVALSAHKEERGSCEPLSLAIVCSRPFRGPGDQRPPSPCGVPTPVQTSQPTVALVSVPFVGLPPLWHVPVFTSFSFVALPISSYSTNCSAPGDTAVDVRKWSAALIIPATSGDARLVPPMGSNPDGTPQQAVESRTISPLAGSASAAMSGSAAMTVELAAFHHALETRCRLGAAQPAAGAAKAVVPRLLRAERVIAVADDCRAAYAHHVRRG